MPQAYLLPCPACDQKLPVEPSQAGGQLKCECGANVTAPAFREIKQLEPAAEALATADRSKWTRLQGVMFSLGILVLLCALALGFFPVVWRTQISLEKPPPLDLTRLDAHVDTWSPEETLLAWDELLEAGVNRTGPPQHIANRAIAQQLNVMIAVAALVALAGLGSAVGAFFVGGKRK